MYNVKNKKEVCYICLNKSCLCRNCRGENKIDLHCICAFDENSTDLCGYAFKFDERKHFAIKQ